MARFGFLILGFFVTGVLAGCGSQPLQPEGPTVARVSAATSEDYDRLWEAASHALRKRYFTIDREDRGEGVLTTLPETSAHWLEFWRPQAEPSYYWWEANLQTIQRQAKVEISPAADDGTYQLSVEVNRLRYSLPERQIDNSAAALRLFSPAAPTYEGRMERPSQTGYWIPLGRDEFLEQKLLTRILEYYGQFPAAAQPADF